MFAIVIGSDNWNGNFCVYLKIKFFKSKSVQIGGSEAKSQKPIFNGLELIKVKCLRASLELKKLNDFLINDYHRIPHTCFRSSKKNFYLWVFKLYLYLEFGSKSNFLRKFYEMIFKEIIWKNLFFTKKKII